MTLKVVPTAATSECLCPKQAQLITMIVQLGLNGLAIGSYQPSTIVLVLSGNFYINTLKLQDCEGYNYNFFLLHQNEREGGMTGIFSGC